MDEAVGHFGSTLSNRLDEVEGKTTKDKERKQAQILGEVLNLPDEQRFKSFRPPSSRS